MIDNMEDRIDKIRQVLAKQKLDAFLVTNFYNIRYLTGFVGLAPVEREAYLLVTPNQAFFFTDGRYLEQAKKLQITNYKLQIIEISPKNNIVKLLSGLIAKLKIKKLGFERNDLSFGEYQKIAQKLTKIKLTPTENLVEDLRAQKEPKEIKNIEKAVQIADRCFSHLLEFLKPGLTEKEVADEIELFIRKQGAVDISFDPIVASGENSSLPHYIMSKSFRLKTNRLVLLDFGAKVEGYCSDMTRVISLGKATSEQKKIYQTVLAAQKKALEALLYYFRVLKSKAPKKIPARMVDKVTRDYLNRFKFKLIHGLGHGVGLTEHEAPRLGPTSKDILKEGMVFSIEPGVYLSKRYGIRIEDLVVMEKTGPRVLTQSTKEIIEI